MSASSPQKIGVLGGTFDPVHQGHLTLAAEALRLFGLDQILFVPAATSPHKQGRDTTPAQHRLEMLRLATEAEPRYEVSEIEIQRGGVSYTTDTLDALQAQHPNTELGLIMGIDTFQDITSWRRFEDLLNNVDILVSSRPGYAFSNTATFLEETLASFPDSYTLTEQDESKIIYTGTKSGHRIAGFLIPPQPVSASQIREGLTQNPSIKKMLPPEVERYIMTHRLYSMHPHSLI